MNIDVKLGLNLKDRFYQGQTSKTVWPGHSLTEPAHEIEKA